ncbi:MAG TPA: TOBE domain-containing protein, partial [Anaerolineales bacterium]|nr:TOBE domain-containing protein [Anaerolineales bacterium]
LRIRTSAGDFPGVVSGPGAVTVLIRPDRARLDGTGVIRFEGVVLERTFRGDQNRLLVKVNETRLSFDFPSSLPLPGPGESISLSLDAADGLHLWED